MIFIAARFTVCPAAWPHARGQQFVLLEAFRDAAAAAAHVQSAHFKAVTRDVPPLLVRTPDIVNVEVPGTAWSKLTELAVPDNTSD